MRSKNNLPARSLFLQDMSLVKRSNAPAHALVIVREQKGLDDAHVLFLCQAVICRGSEVPAEAVICHGNLCMQKVCGNLHGDVDGFLRACGCQGYTAHTDMVFYVVGAL